MRPCSLLTVLMACASVNAQVADAGPDTLICNGPINMQGSPVPLGGNGVWSLIAGCAVIDDPSAPATLVTGLCPGVNTFVWEVNDGVSTTSDTVEVGVVDLPTLANAGPDQTVVGPPFTAQLIGNQPVFPSYCYWTVIAGGSAITDPTLPITWVTLSVGMNVFRYTCVTGPCYTSDEVGINAFVWTGIEDDRAPSTALTYDPVTQQLRSVGAIVDALEVVDVQGRGVLRSSAAGDARSWNIADLPAGLYVARAIMAGHRQVMRFVVGR